MAVVKYQLHISLFILEKCIYLHIFYFYSRNLWPTIPPHYVVPRTSLKGKLPTKGDFPYFTLPLINILSFYGNIDSLSLQSDTIRSFLMFFWRLKLMKILTSCKLRLTIGNWDLSQVFLEKLLVGAFLWFTLIW